MANQFVSALRKEIASLEADLSGDPRFKKFRRLMAALDAYLEDESDDTGQEQLAPKDSSPNRVSEQSAQTGRSASERTQAILDTAETIIARSSKPIKTIEILEELRRRNVDVHGANPRNTLSAIISYSGRFTAHGRAGWTIKHDDDAGENTEAADNPNLGGRMSTASDEHRSTGGGTRAEPVKPAPGGGT